jgi:tRNA(Ile)-lysidine synthase
MLTIDTTHLSNKKNLLAFSAGVDSSALFFLLIKKHIKFDIAIVDYGIRTQSKTEVKHAKALAKRHKLFCHTITAPKYESHFEQKARDFRYEFFESLVTIEGYDNILTAHQLDDQLEWLLMRLTKGAGLSELLGLAPISQRETYTLLRPLLSFTKQELLDYLNTHKYPYFIDASNSDEKYERNLFRKQFSEKLLTDYGKGIQRSFEYLHKDKEILEGGFELIHQNKQLRILKLNLPYSKVKAADIHLKQLGYLLSAAQRKEIEKEDSLVLGGIWALEIQDNLLYIAPYTTIDMPKTFKEKYRVAKIPSKIRPYLYQENIETVTLMLNS